jgi:hypothetical protein
MPNKINKKVFFFFCKGSIYKETKKEVLVACKNILGFVLLIKKKVVLYMRSREKVVALSLK